VSELKIADRGAIADALEQIGLLLELDGANAFKTRAYHAGARALRGLDEDLATLLQSLRNWRDTA